MYDLNWGPNDQQSNGLPLEPPPLHQLFGRIRTRVLSLCATTCATDSVPIVREVEGGIKLSLFCSDQFCCEAENPDFRQFCRNPFIFPETGFRAKNKKARSAKKRIFFLAKIGFFCFCFVLLLIRARLRFRVNIVSLLDEGKFIKSE